MGVTMKSLVAALLISVLALKASAFPFGNPDLDLEWEDFKQRYDKNYELDGEEQGRRMIWEDNLNFIGEHNAAAANGEHTYTVGMNQFGDWSTDEINKFFNGYNASEQFKKAGKLVSLSEQNLVDCEKQDFGCMGGLMTHAFAYIKSNHGIDTESSYPYTAITGKKCLFKPEDVGATLQSYKTIPAGKENDLQTAVATVSVAIDASNPSFHFYKKGIYYEPDCSSTHLDHGVLAVGYGTDSGKDYWLVKNSWDVTWGMD